MTNEDDTEDDKYHIHTNGGIRMVRNESLPSDASWSIQNDQALLQFLLQSVAAAAHGIPLQLLMEHIHGKRDSNIQCLTLPQIYSMFLSIMQSDQCRHIVVLVGWVPA